jgi:hypothetical protein
MALGRLVFWEDVMRTTLTVVLGLLLAVVVAARGQQDKQQQIDPPRHLEGTVKKVDRDPSAKHYLNLTVLDRQPTTQEDISRDVEREYRFEVPASTKVLGLDGKPDAHGLDGLKAGDRVRVEYRKDRALEIKRLLGKGNPAER